MIKRFCDNCGKPNAQTANQKNRILAKKVLCDEKAKIEGTMVFRFVNHSREFGGPPDLCSDCFKKLILQYLDEL